ncbi:hypothetical protein [Kistimonas asteriae]|uniref:hypothetical protein n=1 Tax=Kistimonas asteriae TaxID=517724 RepID=UPI001BABE8B4|nr:hypothetical protein [Kistimonas asteriae]
MLRSLIQEIINNAGLEIYFAFVVFLIIKLYPSLKKHFDNNKAIEKEELELLSEILSNKNKANVSFLIEQIIEKKYGKAISWREISYILELHSPSEALSNYINGKQFINFPISEGEPIFRSPMNKSNYRKFRALWNVFWYFTFSFLCLALLPISAWILGELGPLWFVSTVVFSIYSGWIAYFCLAGLGKIVSAEHFMDAINSQDKYIPHKRNLYY